MIEDIKSLKEQLAVMYDAVDLLDMLEVDNEQLLEKFHDIVVEKFDDLLFEVRNFRGE